MKSINSAKKSKKGRPSVESEAVNVRLLASFLSRIDDWRRRQDDLPGRPEAIRRLVEIGLASAKPPARRSEKNIAKAKELAATTIDHLSDSSAHPDEKASRKRRLLKGPEEFQNLRVDRTQKK